MSRRTAAAQRHGRKRWHGLSFFILGLVLGIFIALATPGRAHAMDVKCLDTQERCQKVQRVIHHVFPASGEHWAIECFSAESGLAKWNDNGQYAGIAQMGSSERVSYRWRRAIRGQIWAAKRMWRARGSTPWYAAGC